MSEEYSREELMRLTEVWPSRGKFCRKCNNYVPQFADLAEEEEKRVRELMRTGRNLLAIQELKTYAGCPLGWAKLWVTHKGSPRFSMSTPVHIVGSYSALRKRNSVAFVVGTGMILSTSSIWERTAYGNRRMTNRPRIIDPGKVVFPR
jgi:hypothetical protein